MINATRENLQIKAQISKGVGSAQRTDLCFAICRFLQVVFLSVYHLEQRHAQYLFLFPISFVLI